MISEGLQMTFSVSSTGRAVVQRSSPHQARTIHDPRPRTPNSSSHTPPLKPRQPEPLVSQLPLTDESHLDPSPRLQFGSPKTPSRNLLSPSRALWREFMNSPTPSPKKHTDTIDHNKIYAHPELMYSLETLLRSQHLLPAGWLPLLQRLIEEGNATLSGYRKGPSKLAHLIAVGERREQEVAQIGGISRKRKASATSSFHSKASKVAAVPPVEVEIPHLEAPIPPHRFNDEEPRDLFSPKSPPSQFHHSHLEYQRPTHVLHSAESNPSRSEILPSNLLSSSAPTSSSSDTTAYASISKSASAPHFQGPWTVYEEADPSIVEGDLEEA